MSEAGPQDAQSAVRRRLDQWRSAFEAKDVDAMMGYYADGPDFTAYDLMPPIEFHGGDAWRANWEYFFGLYDGPIRMEIANDHLYASTELAVFHCLVGLTGTMSGAGTSTMWSRQTICLQSNDGVWTMIHNHLSLPLDLASGRALMTLSPERPNP